MAPSKSAVPGSIAVIGGGRWARQVLDVLAGLLPPQVALSAHSRRGREALRAWAASKGLARRIRVTGLPARLDADDAAVFICNAARAHARAAAWAVGAGLPALIEKPVALDAASALRLAASARRRGVLLASSQVFLFARYLERFRARVASAGGPRSLRVTWTDARREERYGELKSYDSSLPVYADCLPHVLSIAERLARGKAGCEKAGFRKGGARLELALKLGSVPCSVLLERNASRRRRVVEAACARRRVLLDFSREPGALLDGRRRLDPDPLWGAGRRPLSRMALAFLRSAAGGRTDPRLAFGRGVRACILNDEVAGRYLPARRAWLSSRLARPWRLDASLRYALEETLQEDARLSPRALDRAIARLERVFSGARRRTLVERLRSARSPERLLRTLALVSSGDRS